MSKNSRRILEYARLDRKRRNEGVDIDELERWRALGELLHHDRSGSGPIAQGERRRSPRIPTRLRCTFASFGRFERALITNVSFNGVYVKTASPLSVGMRLLLQISIEGVSGSMELPGVVASRNFKPGSETREPGMGIRFTVPDVEIARALKALYTRAVLGRILADGEVEPAD